ncbi:MAG: hypothetical protein U0841_09230 [Chloroflexia bacterium]
MQVAQAGRAAEAEGRSAAMNWRTTFQFQFARAMPTSAGLTCTATFKPA